MKLTSTTCLIGMLCAAPAFAEHLSLKSVDADGDNFASYEEMAAALPNLSQQEFRAMDGNSDNRLSSAEINEPKAQQLIAQHPTGPSSFGTADTFDGDGDGFITYADITKVYPTFSELTYMDVDENDDNRLSYEEFYSARMQQGIAACSHGDALDMAKLDVNGDNFIDMSEMQAAMPGIHQADFQKVDVNDDNRISSAELLMPDAGCFLGGH